MIIKNMFNNIIIKFFFLRTGIAFIGRVGFTTLPFFLGASDLHKIITKVIPKVINFVVGIIGIYILIFILGLFLCFNYIIYLKLNLLIYCFPLYHLNWIKFAIFNIFFITLILTYRYSNLFLYHDWLYMHLNKTNFKKFFLFMIKHIAKIIIGSVIIKTVILIVTSILMLTEINNNIIAYITSFPILLLIFYSLFKSSNKIRYLIRLTFNLAIIYVFWYMVLNYCSMELAIILLANNIIFIIDDWDIGFDFDIDAFNPLGSHDKCMNDPSVRPPNPDPLHVDPCTGEYDEDKNFYPNFLNNQWKWANDSPILQDYKNYYILDGIKYNSCVLKKAIALSNETVSMRNSNNLNILKECIDQYIHNYPSKTGTTANIYACWYLSPSDTFKYIIHDKYVMMQEYNTLMKANSYYSMKGVDKYGQPLDESFKEAFVGWQKRQLLFYFKNYVHDLHKDYKYYNCKYYVSKYPKVPFENFAILSDYFDDENVYYEVKENLLWVKLHIIHRDYLIEHLQNIDLDDIPDDLFRALVMEFDKNCYEQYKDVHDALAEYQRKKFMPDDKIKKVFKCCVWDSLVYLKQNEGKYDFSIVDRMNDHVFGLDKKFFFKGFKSTFYKNILIEKDTKDSDMYVGYGFEKKLQFKSLKHFLINNKPANLSID